MGLSDTRPFVRTKLVATLGPASANPECLQALFRAGVDVCRLNFSHGDLEGHQQTLAMIRAAAAEQNLPVAVLGDLCGPKIRLGMVRGGGIDLQAGRPVRFVRGECECTEQELTATYPKLLDEVQAGQRIYIDDGLVRLNVIEKEPDALVCECAVSGRISSRKGVNLPDTRLSVPALTDKDRRDLAWAIQNQLEYVALSFVRRPADVRELRGLLDEAHSRIGIISKIEKVEALEHLDDIVALSNGIMVARGDLGVEMDVWQVPLVQKALTARCREAGKPVIIATQMLQSMVANPMPTRAEVSDVANAILDGVDAVMLSAETASGQYPIEAAAMMNQVAHVTETYQLRRSPPPEAAPSMPAASRATSAIAHAAVQAALDSEARLVAVWTATGETVRLVAQHRLPMPVVGLSFDEQVCRRLNLLYGVLPVRLDPIDNPAKMAAVLDAKLLERDLARVGDLIVVVTSTRPTTPEATDTVLAHRVSERVTMG